MTVTLSSQTNTTRTVRLPQIPREQQDSRLRFGRALHAWMKQNDLSLQVPHEWSQANGKFGPHNSQLSLCTRGVFDPKAMFFVQLGKFNAALEVGDHREVPDQLTRDRLKRATPFMTVDGRVATGADFFAMFTGEQPCGIEEEESAADDAGLVLTAREIEIIQTLRARG